MTAVYVDIFPICILLVILYDLRRNYTLDKKSKWFQLILFATLTVLFSDIAGWLLDGRVFPCSDGLLLAVNIIFFAVGTIASYIWFLFSYYILYGELVFKKHWRHFILFSLPLVFFLLILLLKTDWIIIISNNQYQRGPYFYIQTIIGLMYMLLGCSRAFIHGIREKVPSRRSQYFLLSSFLLFPLTGGIIQIINMNFVFLWPLTMISLLLYYLSQRHDDIQKDDLTGLFNRRWLDEYLSQAFYDQEATEEWHLFLIDLNRFKRINDTYGHSAGDEALKKAADILQRVFNVRDAYVARYGGDEFAVVIKCPEEKIPRYIKRLNDTIYRHNENAGKGYKVSLSFGIASWHPGKYKRLDDFISQADRNMYLQKNKNRSKTDRR